MGQDSLTVRLQADGRQADRTLKSATERGVGVAESPLSVLGYSARQRVRR